MAVELKKANRLQSGKLVNKLVNDYWTDLINSRQQGKLVCYTTGLPIGQFLAAQDIAWIHGEGYGARVAARHEEIEPQINAERRGYNRELCSYARTQMGCVMFAEHGVPLDLEVGPIAKEIPVPDLIITCYPGCTSGPQWDWAIERMFPGKKVPWFNVVIPYHYGRNGSSYMKGEEFEQEVAYVERQLRDMCEFIGKISGRPYNYDKLSELMDVTKKCGKLRKEAMELCAAKPAPASFFDWSQFIAPVNYLSGLPGTVEAMQAAKDEIIDRIKHGVSAVPNEKYRLFWEGIMNWNRLGWMANKFANYDACVVAGRYTHMAFWQEPDVIDPANPLKGVAINHLECQLGLGYPITEERMFGLCKQYSIDGVILHGARTCRSFGRSHYLMAENLAKKLDISSTMFEGDMVDESFYKEEVVNTRIEALLESLEAKKQRQRAI
jgi:benzoyl-CoA reductase subunit B